MINCTKHSKEKYALRIKKIDEKEIKEFIYNNNDLISSDVNKMFDNSNLIYTGHFKDHVKANYRLADNILLVTDLQDTKVITLYKVKFGFGREADRVVRNVLLNELKEADEKYKVAEEKVRLKKEELLADKLKLKEEIDTLRQTLRSLEDSHKSLDNYISTMGHEETIAKSERDIIAKKIVYSNIYRKALEEYTE